MKALNLGTLWHNEIMIKQNSNKTKSRLHFLLWWIFCLMQFPSLHKLFFKRNKNGNKNVFCWVEKWTIMSPALLKHHWENMRHKLKQTTILSVNNKTEMILQAPYITLTLGPLISQELTWSNETPIETTMEVKDQTQHAQPHFMQ